MARWVFLSLRRRGQIGVQSFLQLRTRIPYGSRARTSEGDGGVCSDCSDLRVAGAVHDYHGGKVAEQRPSVAPVCRCAASDLPARTRAAITTRLLLGRQKFVAIFRRFFGREAVASSVFSYHARDEEIQEVIFATGLGAAAAHFESPKGMASNNRAGARAIDIDISRLQLGFNALDIGWAAREKSAGQRVIGAVRYFEGFIEIAHF